MSEDFGATGIDPEWYDHGPGSEEWKHKRRLEHLKWENEAFERKKKEQEDAKKRDADKDAEIAELKTKLAKTEEECGNVQAFYEGQSDRSDDLQEALHKRKLKLEEAEAAYVAMRKMLLDWVAKCDNCLPTRHQCAGELGLGTVGLPCHDARTFLAADPAGAKDAEGP